MKRFIARHAEKILGVLSGLDRLVLRGTLRRIAYVEGLGRYLNWRRVLLKEFGDFAARMTERVRAASTEEARRLGRPVVYLESSRKDKERVALEIAEREGIREGLIAVLECVEPCITFDLHRNRAAKRLELVSRIRKCLHIYHYWIDPIFGLMNARIQSWLPFNVQVCLNGREWLAREMSGRGLGYRRWDNCFPWLEDVEQAQRLMDEQLGMEWAPVLDRIALRLNPAHPDLFGADGPGYYWSVYQSEWATDVMFRSPETLAEVYPPLVHHGITTFGSTDVMRFLGRRVRADFSGEIVSDFKERVEGVRIKHRVDGNSLKGYDKWSIFRVETTINQPHAFRVFRPKEGGREDDCAWRTMRQGIADLHRRAQVSQASNERYLDALSAVDTSTPLGQLVSGVCQPINWKGKRVRALRPWAEEDMSLLQAVARGEFHLQGFRNRDLATLLDTPAEMDPLLRRRHSARITRKIRLLRAHGLIRKLGKSHRYVLTAKGHDIIPAILAAQRVSLQQLQRIAA
ncbi:MAG: hypothetical protein L0191_01515 [Acidobacteria bacterium]|nr:hypothetical protein [Acidobacteriota bacterium]